MLLSAIEKGGAPDRPKGVANVYPPHHPQQSGGAAYVDPNFLFHKKVETNFFYI